MHGTEAIAGVSVLHFPPGGAFDLDRPVGIVIGELQKGLFGTFYPFNESVLPVVDNDEISVSVILPDQPALRVKDIGGAILPREDCPFVLIEDKALSCAALVCRGGRLPLENSLLSGLTDNYTIFGEVDPAFPVHAPGGAQETATCRSVKESPLHFKRYRPGGDAKVRSVKYQMP